MSEEVQRKLIEMFLAELRQVWWVEALAKLRDEKRKVLDPELALGVGERIREHYKLRHETDLTRNRLSSKRYLRHSPHSD
ncbi:MAG TPA: hypothetical protein VGU03_09025 [Frateuria sp.]|uniref:hypothetical protein n=1 Tax=Frateuria sp. TaxID=2211372 RepID=UPI002DE94A14|nr:hypothetical protein [Frateuria sp.]